MSQTATADYYEILQISPNADADTIQRVFRLLAQRFHPDNQETGNATRFRELHDAYLVLSDPEKRARYDVAYHAARQDRWRLTASAATGDNNDVDMEQQLRYILLEILYTRRRTEPDSPSLSPYDLCQLTGQPREHLEFTVWYLSQKKFLTRDDQSKLTITVDGVDYVEQHSNANTRRRLTAVK